MKEAAVNETGVQQAERLKQEAKEKKKALVSAQKSLDRSEHKSKKKR